MASTLLSSIHTMVTKLTASVQSSPSTSSSSLELTRFEEDLKKLKRTVQRIQAVLTDAEEREIRDESVNLWLKEIKEVAYDAEDVLGEYQYELLRAQIESAASRKRKREEQVTDLTSTISRLSIPERIGIIRERFDEISKDRDALHLREGDGIRRQDASVNWRQPTSSHLDESSIFGREEDKEELIEMLLRDESCRFSVIPILGMGGLGKTTLAQLVYKDDRVRQYFDYWAWVCVSESFDVIRLTNEIIESMTKKTCSLKQLNALQDILKEKLAGKKVLVVLDDVWNEQQGPWDSLRGGLSGAATSVRVVVTTRNESVAKLMQTVRPYRPGRMSYEHCWLLFQHRAFGGHVPKEYQHLVDISRKIIEKCGRLPLSVKVIGGLLRYESDEVRWMEILESDLWDLDQARKDIIPALKLSYHHLPPHLKPCFLYSSLFPKDYEFAKYRLVKLWMAQGFIRTNRGRRLEDVGREYIDELQSRSLFTTYYSYRVVLHDAIHDLARSISDNEYCAITLNGDKEQYNIPKEVRHLFIGCERGARFNHLSFGEPGGLRTLIVERRFYMEDDFIGFDGLDCLRAVEVKGDYCLNSIGNLKHLRHLRVKGCTVEDDSLSSPCHLYNLQSLEMNVGKTECLINTSSLVNLRHLRLLGPQGRFKRVIGIDDKVANFLHSCVPHLQKLKIKRNCELTRLQTLPLSLQFLWISHCPILTTLPCLQNLTSLAELHLVDCKSLQFGPDELLPSKLQKVHISRCRELSVLAGLKNLTSLAELHLIDCPRLQFIPDESLPCRPQLVNIIKCPRLINWCREHQFHYLA